MIFPLNSGTMEYKAKILIVDDIPENLQILNHLLSEESYEVRAANSGFQALQILPKFNPDLILLDISMPEIDGFQVIQQLKKNPLTAEIPVIFLTAKAMSEDIVKGFKSGASDYVTKPFRTEELLSRVRTHIDLKFRSQQLKYMNEELEKKVEDRTKELQLANSKLSVLEKAKNDFLLIVNHELRTPIHGISGFIQILKNQPLPAEYHEYISMLSASANRLVKLSESALLFTSLRAGYQNISPQTIQVNQIADTVLSEYSELLQSKKINVAIENNQGQNSFMADKKLTTLAISKILDNAIRHCKHSGTIEIKSDIEANYFVIQITDEGTGFSETDIQNLYHLFHSGSSTNQTYGFGLGLATVKLIMEIQEGYIEAFNNNNGFATVKLFFKLLGTENQKK